MDAMYGRTTSLKTNYMLDNKEVQAYLKKALSGQIKDKETGEKINAKKWKDAFNSKGSVNNKQEYFDLLMSYIRNETNYNDLTEKYSKTLNGQMTRLSGYWDTLKADLLGIDTNTGMAKGGITVFSSVKDGLDKFQAWLKDDKTKDMLDKIGNGLGKAVNSIVKAFEKLLEGDKLQKIGDVFEKIGDKVAEIVDKLNKDGTLDKLLDALPKLVDTVVKDKVIDTTTKVKTGADFADGKWFQGAKDWTKGTADKYNNLLGTNGDTIDINGGKMVNPYTNITSDSSISSDYLSGLSGNILTDANASTILAQNSNITEDQRNQVKDMLKNDNQTVYNVTIGEIKADNFEQIVDAVQKAQANHK